MSFRARPPLLLMASLAAAFVTFHFFPRVSRAQEPGPTALPGLTANARIIRDSNAVPHIFAQTDRDAMMLLGYAHAQDRLFQMDYLRRTFSGTAAELTGQTALVSDTQLRTIGIRRAAEASLPAYSAETRALLDGYAAGVNAYLNGTDFALPPEYEALELTRASIPQWTALDSVTMAKGLAFQLSFDQLELTLTPALAAYQQAGREAGFDGSLLFFEDVFRIAPFDPTVSIPPSTSSARRAARRPSFSPNHRTLRLAEQYAAKLRQIPLLRHTVDASIPKPGSNFFVIGGGRTASGFPLIANDPHLSLTTPSVFYEAHLQVADDPQRGAMNVNGVSFPGVPGILLGCNDRVCWGATINPLDVTDIYQEKIALTFGIIPRATLFEGREEPLTLIQQSFRVNRTGNGVADDVVDANLGVLDGAITLLVPRRNNGPIVAIDISDPQAATGLSVQYTGLGATLEIDAPLGLARARNVEEFRQALQSIDFGSLNWCYADVEGNIAYFTSAELPLREDLQDLARVDGNPPYLIRDGTHEFRNEWKPLNTRQPGQAVEFEILPFGEMPQTVNPSQGFIVNGNQDPIGITLDNDPLNQLRPGGGIFYLSPGYAGGFRQGRLVGLLQGMEPSGEKITLETVAVLQANNQMLDAQVFTPFLMEAVRNARTLEAPQILTALAGDRGVTEAIDRLSGWDYSTPTGIVEGYDPGDDPSVLPTPLPEEVKASVSATIYSVWRARILRNTIDRTLERYGLASPVPPNDQSLAALRVLLERFGERRGRGASGVNFFEVEGASTPEIARDVLLLRSLREALDLLAGDDFAAAFNKSQNQDDYRWGKLHRVVFDHPLGGSFNIPPAGGFSHLAEGLPGLARAGGFETVDASTHGARAASANAFMFNSGPSRRFIGEMTPGGPHAWQILPGGQIGNPMSPLYAAMLGRWLGNHYHQMLMTIADVESERISEQSFVPAQ